ncbi:hypothetical protein G6F56_008753 [Rhizopus delemar]|nr:hypothetical protein G6F56_008753 [Rhizopus delemar]
MINSSSTLTDSTKFEDVHEKQTRKDSCEDSVGVYFDTNAKVDRAEEKKLVRKLDLRIMPLFCLFYFADFLDRANIGNAALAGIQVDLDMTSTQLSTAISAFFITYILFEIPSNIVLEKTNAAKWLSFIMFVWGLATLAVAFVNNFTGLLIARLILGAAESGFVPGILFLLSKVYKPQEFTIRVSILLTMGTLSGAVSGPLAFAASSIQGELRGWQYLFLVEGAPTIILSFVSYCFLFDDLQKVKWLTDEQKKLQNQRLVIESSSRAATLSVLWIALSDWKTWVFGILLFMNCITIVSFGVFSPVLING